jgi:hypothetical protein
MTSLFQGVIYQKNLPIYDIILKSDNLKISLWYLIRLYYEKQRNDLFESFIIYKLKHLLSSNNKHTFIISYSNFTLENNSLLSTLLFMMSNDIITLSNISKWTEEFNTIYPEHSILVRHRLVFDTDSRMFYDNITLDKINFEKITNPLDLQYKLQNKYKKLIVNHSINNYSTNSHKYLSDNIVESTLKNNKTILEPFQFQNYKTNISINMNKYIPSDKTNSLLDDYNKWSLKKKYNRYTLNSLLLLDSHKKKK